jgi:predicted nucleotide-binding protein
MADAATLNTILLAMEETARAIAAEPRSERDTSRGTVSPAFLRQLNALLREVNVAVPSANLVVFDDSFDAASVSYPRTLEVLQQIKLALSFLGGPAQTATTLSANESESGTAPSAMQGRSDRPSVFIGCSVEGMRVAKVVQLALSRSSRPVLWHQGVFGLSRGTLESLVEKAHEFRYAVLVLTPDDLLIKQGESTPVARDNVLFELGLFMGALGRERTFIVCERSVALPTDLAGITPATYELTEPTALVADLGPVCTRLELQMGLL